MIKKILTKKMSTMRTVLTFALSLRGSIVDKHKNKKNTYTTKTWDNTKQILKQQTNKQILLICVCCEEKKEKSVVDVVYYVLLWKAKKKVPCCAWKINVKKKCCVHENVSCHCSTVVMKREKKMCCVHERSVKCCHWSRTEKQRSDKRLL